jgi:hypothetical protein
VRERQGCARGTMGSRGRSVFSFYCFGGNPLSTCVVFRRFTGIHFNTIFRAMGTAVLFSQVLKGVRVPSVCFTA